MKGDLLGFGITKKPEAINAGLVRLIRKLSRFFLLLVKEFRTNVSLPIRDSLRSWRYGFTRWSYFLYGLDKHDPRMFVNDYVQYLKMDFISDLHRRPCMHKVIFSRYAQSIGVPCPYIHALIIKGHIYTLDTTKPVETDWLFDLLKKNPSGIVLKPVIGHEGFGVSFLKSTNHGYELNGKIISDNDPKAIVSQLDDYFITDFVVQHQYSAGLYPRTTNTLRLLTLWDYDVGQPFLAAAIQRIGTSRSYPVDNFKMGKGGLSALVDYETGKLGLGVTLSDYGHIERHVCHPETGNQIEGVFVPRWKETIQNILRFCVQIPFLPLIGWDVVITSNGYQVVEINSGCGLYVIQAHIPLLANSRVKRFFEFHNCI